MRPEVEGCGLVDTHFSRRGHVDRHARTIWPNKNQTQMRLLKSPWNPIARVFDAAKRRRRPAPRSPVLTRCRSVCSRHRLDVDLDLDVDVDADSLVSLPWSFSARIARSERTCGIPTRHGVVRSLRKRRERKGERWKEREGRGGRGDGRERRKRSDDWGDRQGETRGAWRDDRGESRSGKDEREKREER
uniref:Uncharacterized protein n=1 Tax=Knipowitschia caucasica TaxID=637954 RepID=A0AAV2K5Z6_KNICA